MDLEKKVYSYGKKRRNYLSEVIKNYKILFFSKVLLKWRDATNIVSVPSLFFRDDVSFSIAMLAFRRLNNTLLLVRCKFFLRWFHFHLPETVEMVQIKNAILKRIGCGHGGLSIGMRFSSHLYQFHTLHRSWHRF